MTKEIQLKKKIDVLAVEAGSILIEDAKSMKKATIILSNINKYVDSVKEEKDKLTKPINTALKNIRTMFKPLEETYEAAIDSIRGKMRDYQTKSVLEARRAEEAIANRVKEGRGNLSIDTAVKKISEIKKPEKEVATDAGLIQFVETKKFEITDKSKIPLEYLVPDETSIRKAMKEGKELPGIRYYTEMEPRNYR